MIIYDFSERNNKSMYEFLYDSLKRDILNGRLAQGSKLPSKRTLAKDNLISVRTVMNAYDQLLAEGFIVSEERKGYFVAKVYEDDVASLKRSKTSKQERPKDYIVDFTAHKLVCDRFPISMWKKIMREVLTDYDCEYRYDSRLAPAIACTDTSGKVIYINSFSKSLAPSIRISYMVLPKELMERYQRIAGVYSNSVCSLDQYTLAKFLNDGYFERHMRRMKKYCQEQGNRLLKYLMQSHIFSKADIHGGKSGTHFLVKIHTPLGDQELVEEAKKQKVKIRCLSKYCREDQESYKHVIVFRYTDASDEEIKEAIKRLERIIIKSDTQN